MGPCPNNIVNTQLHTTVLKKQVLSGTDLTYKHAYVWRNIIFMAYAHIGAVYGLFLLLAEDRRALLFDIVYGYFSLIGITAGTHRLWSHRAYKARFPLRVILMILQTMAFQNHIYEWARDHRVHHKFSETDGDPHNAKRGFFFCHMGWLLVKKHPDVLSKGKRVDMSDLERDPVVVWQRKYYPILMPMLAFVLPTWIPVYLWGTDPWTAWYGTLFRWVVTVNGTWCVNSFAHLWGSRPYNTEINPTESPFVIGMTIGEGFHNYHHTFPYDYKAAELRSPIFNTTAMFIDFFAKFGWAYDLKVVSEETVRKRTLRTGDGSHPKYKVECHVQKGWEDKDMSGEHIWGWGDKDISQEDIESVDLIK